MRDTPTDGELLGAADHDPHAFRVLYDRWAEPLLAFCYRRTCDAEASLDLVAETFATPRSHCGSRRAPTPRRSASGPATPR